MYACHRQYYVIATYNMYTASKAVAKSTFLKNTNFWQTPQQRSEERGYFCIYIWNVLSDRREYTNIWGYENVDMEKMEKTTWKDHQNMQMRENIKDSLTSKQCSCCQGLKAREQGQRLVNWFSRILEVKDFPRGQQQWRMVGESQSWKCKQTAFYRKMRGVLGKVFNVKMSL